MIQKIFAIGNSVAVTIPKRFGLVRGTAIRHLPRIRNRFSYEVVEDAPKVKQRFSGGIKLNMSTEEFMRIKAYCRENAYEKI
ncbi:hypothetical protein COT50_03525 [candidate division WWE3 bacterium CG08_land_8_20_14_0_20_41_10]|uniref:Uncharacterized protein n=1 Tax=candidate division WWE3 bacterium CG08_land_8_20_14_0_20_41_10 TaxID=1975085 RepID=A0A2H0XB89_UNCKA|nr:MAG: hypothetical protein COT50_03525 [candidate division WWE3 bacterium CG08_land_8_20_14_0_20_41_10]